VTNGACLTLESFQRHLTPLSVTFYMQMRSSVGQITQKHPLPLTEKQLTKVIGKPHAVHGLNYLLHTNLSSFMFIFRLANRVKSKTNSSSSLNNRIVFGCDLWHGLPKVFYFSNRSPLYLINLYDPLTACR